jgi:hypothetical protein
MNKYQILVLKSLRKVYIILFKDKKEEKPECIQDADFASQIIYDTLMFDAPCMIARFGSTELITIVNYLGVKYPEKNILKYIKGKSFAWWWSKGIMEQMQRWSGFFPPTPDKIEQFCEMMLEDMKEVDVLGSWIQEEQYFSEKIKTSQKVSLILLEPYISANPWSRCLKGKKVLVVHPFALLIEEQYEKRKLLFKNPDVLPDFELQTITAVQSLGGEDNGFQDWFEALEYMKDEIDKKDYDICLIGCGAYGFPLAAHVKYSGKKAVHLGGALQLLFGIKGNRWEDPGYALKWNLPQDTYLSIFNEYWVKPSGNFKPLAANKVENACYW